MEEHTLKCWPLYFVDLLSGKKTAEVRLNDRGFKAGDIVRFKEWDPETEQFTGEEMIHQITHVLTDFDGIMDGYAVLSLGN